MHGVSPPSAPQDAATPADAAGPSSTSPPAWSPMQSGNRDRAASGTQPRIGFKRGRSDEEGDGGGGGGASLLASGLGDLAAAVGNSAKRRALASRLSMGERRTWRAGATPHAGARLLPALPAPERAPQNAATDAAGGSATPGAHAAKLNSSAARRILMSLQSVDLVRSLLALQRICQPRQVVLHCQRRARSYAAREPAAETLTRNCTPFLAYITIRSADILVVFSHRRCRAPMSTQRTISRRRCLRRQVTASVSRRHH